MKHVNYPKMEYPAELEGANDLQKFENLCKLKHQQVFVWCANAAWDKGVSDVIEKWHGDYYKTFCNFDPDFEDGCTLDEMGAHRFYEHYKDEKTVRELRDLLREINFLPKPLKFSWALFVILQYKLSWHEVVNAPQGDAGPAIREAQRLLDEALSALEAASAAAEAASAAADAAKAAADAATAAAADAKQKAEESAAKEAELKAAKAEVEAALAEVKAQEDAREKKTQDLTKKSEGSGVAAMRAKQELAQHLGEDPLPLRKAKITLEAANRKATKAADAATAAREAAEAAHAEAEQKKEASLAAAAAAEEARLAAVARQEEADQAVKEAEEELQRLKKMGDGGGQGTLAWMELTLKDAQKWGKRKK